MSNPVHAPEPVIFVGHDLLIEDLNIYRLAPATTRNIEMVTLRATHLTLVRPVIDGSKPIRQGFRNATEGEHGIGIHGCTTVRIIEPVITNVCGDFVYLGPRGLTTNTDVVIERPTFNNSGRHGIAALSVRGLTVAGPGSIWGFRNSGVDTERQFGGRSVHEDIHIDRDTVDIRSWRKLKKQGLV